MIDIELRIHNVTMVAFLAEVAEPTNYLSGRLLVHFADLCVTVLKG